MKSGYFSLLFLCFSLCITAQNIDNPYIISHNGISKVVDFPAPLSGQNIPFTIMELNDKTPNWAILMYSPDANFADIQDLYKKWRVLNPDIKDGHTRNFRKLRSYLVRESYVDVNGSISIPSSREISLKNQKLAKDRKFYLKHQERLKSSSNTDWSLIGPTFKKTTTGNLVNRHINIYSITQSPNDTDILYCVSESGATVFKSIDNGLNWFSVSDDLIANLGSRNIEVSHSDSDIVYLCGKHDIFKTTVGGNVWNSVYNFNNSNNRTLIIHPTNPDIVMAGGSNGILKTVDGGQNWYTPLAGKSIYDIRYKPGSTSTIYALVDNSTTNQTDFYKSTDSGETWSVRSVGWPSEASNSNIGGQMTTSDGNPDIIFAFVGATWTNANNEHNVKILKSEDSGETWTLKVDYDNEKNINSGQGYYDWDIEMSDTDPNIVAFGTQNSWISYDGLETVTSSMRHGWSGHADIQEMLFQGDEVWVVNDGGITKYENDSLYNFSVRSTGINAISYWGFDQAWNKDVSCGVHYHNGTSAMHENYEPNVAVNFGGAEPHFAFVAQPNGDKAGSKGYGSVNGRLMPDTQDGEFTSFNYALTPNNDYIIGNNGATHPLYYNTHYQPSDNKLVKSEDFGVTWNDVYEFPLADDYVWDVRMSRANTDAIFVSTLRSAGANLYRSLDAGKSFQEITIPPYMDVNPKIMNIEVSNSDENTFYIMCNKWGTRIAKTNDGGQSWFNLDSDVLDDYSGFKLLIADGTDGGIYLLAREAIFYRNNTMPDWVQLVSGAPANTSYDFIKPFYRDNELRVATSRGIYGAELFDTPELSDILVQPSVQQKTVNCVRDTFFYDDFSIVEHAGASWSWSFPGASYVSDASVRNPKVLYSTPGDFDVTLTISKNGQTYTKTIEKMVTVNEGCETVDDFAGNAIKLSRTSNDYVQLPDMDVTTNTFTFSAWVKLEGNMEAFTGIFTNGVWCAHCNDQTLGLGINYFSNSIYYRWPGSTSGWAGGSSLALPSDEWAFVAMVMEPNKVTLRVNDETWVDNRSHDPVSLGALRFGSGNYSRFFKGQIDEAAFWKRALTQQELKELMHLTKDPSADPDLIAYYQMNEEVGSIQDKAGTNHGSLVGATRTESSAPVGGGESESGIETTGYLALPLPGVDLNFTSHNAIEVTASRIDTTAYNANGIIENDTPLNDEYWSIHRFGSGELMFDVDFKVDTDLTSADASVPSKFALYGRKNTSDFDWTFLKVASSANASTDKITFENIEGYYQYQIMTSDQPVVRAQSILNFNNTVVNGSTIKSYAVSGNNLTADLNITAPADFEISLNSISGFSSTLTIVPTSGTILPTTVYVKYSPIQAKLYEAKLSHVSGNTSLDVNLIGEGVELDREPGQTLDFDGSNDYVDIDDIDVEIGEEFTFEFWSKYTGSSRNSVVYAYGESNERILNIHFPWSDNNIYFDAGNSTGYDRINNQIEGDDMLGWHFWSFVKEATTGTMSIYRDGVLWYSETGLSRSMGNIHRLVFGRDNGGNDYEGSLDEIRIWKTARTQAQIKTSMHLTLEGSEPGLVSYFQNNEYSGNVLDRIGGLSGVLINGTNRITATEPVGGGFADSQIEMNGTVVFSNTDFEADFSIQSGQEVVASKIELAPNDQMGLGANEFPADQQYWAVNRYGGGSFTADLTFVLEEDLTAAESTTPGDVRLYARDYNSEGIWTFVLGASAVNAVDNSVTFDDVTSFDQYLISRLAFPKITTTTSELNFGTVSQVSTTELTYNVSGENLSGNIVITPASGFDISLSSGSGFVSFPNTLTLTQSGGVVTSIPIYVRYVASNSGYDFGNMIHTSTGAVTENVNVDVTVVEPEIEVRKLAEIIESGDTYDFGNFDVGDSRTITFDVKNIGLDSLLLTSDPIVTLSGANAGEFSLDISLLDATLFAGDFKFFDVTFLPTSSGSKSATLTIDNNDVDESSYVIDLIADVSLSPELNVTSVTDFGEQLIGGTMVEQTYNVMGSQLISPLNLTASIGFEISLTSGSGFGQTLTIDPVNGDVPSTTVYVRFNPQSVSYYDGQILHTSSNLSTVVVDLTGSSYENEDTVPGQLLSLNGIDEWVRIYPENMTLDNHFTVEFWTNFTGATNDNNSIFYVRAPNGSRVINIHMPWSGTMYFDAGDNGNYDRIQKSVSGDVLLGWHHWAFTKDATLGEMKIYRDGELWHSGTGKIQPIGDLDRFNIGKGEGNHFYEGEIEEFRLWNTTRSQMELRENMHLTQLSSQPDLIMYHQMNELNNQNILSTRAGGNGVLFSTAEIIASMRPVGGGFSNTQIEDDATAVDFPTTDVAMDFQIENGAEVVVSKLNLAPNIIPSGLPRVFDDQYWAIHRYGNGVFETSVTFGVSEEFTDRDEGSPSDIVLYGRNVLSDDPWIQIATASSVSDANNTVTFDGVTQFEQYLIASTTDGQIVNCLTDVLYENTMSLPLTTSSSTFIKAGDLTGNGGVEVLNGQEVTFKAGQYIELESMFEVKAGAVFEIIIENCTPSSATENVVEEKR